MSLVFATGIPVVGVVLFGWDAHAVMFIMSWEVITTSASLSWLFNYPQRSTGAALGLMGVLAPTGFLLWVLIAESYSPGARSVASTAGALAQMTWISLALVTLNAVLFCRRRMADMRRHGVSLHANDQLLVAWICRVFMPFGVFAGVMATSRSIGPWGLAIVLGLKSAIDLMVFLGRSDGKR